MRKLTAPRLSGVHVHATNRIARCHFVVPLSAVLVSVALWGKAAAQTATEPVPQLTPELTAAQLDSERSTTGTSWQPDVLPHEGAHGSFEDWRLSFHAKFFLGYDIQSGNRGADTAVGIAWLTATAARRLGEGHFAARLMLSPEPFTVANGGYPLLLQTGESFKNQPLVDKQHGYDFFTELGALYNLDLSAQWALQLYAAAAGAPALGPAPFAQRASATWDPFAPIGHHFQDSTHISFGVLTAGLASRTIKIETSVFNGREPDDNRYDIELRAPDSYALRLAFMPLPSVAGQVSYGRLGSPDRLDADRGLRRITASVTHVGHLPSDRQIATSAVWGVNKRDNAAAASSVLLETTVNLTPHHVVFGRAEYARKVGRELLAPMAIDRFLFDVASLSAGYGYNFAAVEGIHPGVGARLTLNLVADGLASQYSSRHPMGAVFFLRLA